MMYPLTYKTLRRQGFDQIHIAGNPVYLTVYPAENDAYLPVAAEKRFYCEHQEQLLIFETTGYQPLMNPFHLQGLHAAIKWYGATRLNQPDFKIRLTDPRRNGQKRLKD